MTSRTEDLSRTCKHSTDSCAEEGGIQSMKLVLADSAQKAGRKSQEVVGQDDERRLQEIDSGLVCRSPLLIGSSASMRCGIRAFKLLFLGRGDVGSSSSANRRISIGRLWASSKFISALLNVLRKRLLRYYEE